MGVVSVGTRVGSRHRWWRGLASVLASVASSAIVFGVMTPPLVAAEEEPTSPRSSVLFSLTGDAATMRLQPGAENRYVFTLKGADKRTVWFSNRPARHSGTLPTTGLVDQWAQFGFAEDPPNVAITLHEPDGDTDTIVAVMRKPRIDTRGTLRAIMEVLTNEKAQALTGNLARHGDAHDTTIPRALGSVSIFIDYPYGCIIDPEPWCPKGGPPTTPPRYPPGCVTDPEPWCPPGNGRARDDWPAIPRQTDL